MTADCPDEANSNRTGVGLDVNCTVEDTHFIPVLSASVAFGGVSKSDPGEPGA
jgi:hypothetical protein